ncbi:MAG: hypothetical protein AABP62_22360 [Planctomycetota bacterium]
MKLPFEIPDPKHPDMSPEAIDQRLRDLGQIYKLAMSLRDAKCLGPVSERAQRGEPVEECVVTFPTPKLVADVTGSNANN